MKLVIGICAAALVSELIVAAYVPLQDNGDRMTLQRPIVHKLEYAYIYPILIPYAHANLGDDRSATLELYEDGKLLGPANSTFFEIVNKGQGRYVYFSASMGKVLLFSTSDNSDPNTNGRTYRIFDPKAIDPYEKQRTRIMALPMPVVPD